jgi:hypothetical protein
VAATKPEPRVLHGRLLHVAAFLAEFGCKLAPISKHPFLRQGVELRMLNLFDVNFDILRELSPNSEPQPVEEAEEEGETAVVKKSTAPQLSTGRTSVQPVFPTPTQLADNSVFYLRWMWIQFPWLCLSATADVGAILKVGGLASVLAEVAATGGKQARRQQLEAEERLRKEAVDAAAMLRNDLEMERLARNREQIEFNYELDRLAAEQSALREEAQGEFQKALQQLQKAERDRDAAMAEAEVLRDLQHSDHASAELDVQRLRENLVTQAEWHKSCAEAKEAELAELRGLSEARRLIEVLEREDVGAALRCSANELGRVNLDKVFVGKKLAEERAHSRLDPKDGLVGGRAEVDPAKVERRVLRHSG